jgi:hypothetical protein
MDRKVGEEYVRDILKDYLAGKASISGVLLLVNEKKERIELLTLNATNDEAFLLLLHGIQSIYGKALGVTPSGSVIH